MCPPLLCLTSLEPSTVCHLVAPVSKEGNDFLAMTNSGKGTRASPTQDAALRGDGGGTSG